MSDKALIPIEQREVIFYEDELTAVVIDERNGRIVYVPLRPLCDHMGLNWDGQRRRTLRDPVLKKK